MAQFGIRNWIYGSSAKCIATTLFNKAIRKKVMVHKSITNNKWISHVSPISTHQEIREFVALRKAINAVQLDPKREDNIRASLTFHVYDGFHSINYTTT